MIKQLKRKFIFTAMIGISIILVTLLGTINVINIHTIYNGIDEVLLLLSENVDNKLCVFDDEGDDFTIGSFLEDPKSDLDTILSSNFFVVQFDGNGSPIYVNTNQITSLTDKDAISLASRVRTHKKDIGEYGKYQFHMLFKDNNPVGSRFFPLTLAMGIIAFGAFMLTYFLCEERIKPVQEEKQKFNYVETVKAIGKNRPMIGLILCTLVFKLFCFSAGSTNQYVFMCYFKNTDLLALSNMASLLPMLLCMTCVTPLTKKFGKKALCSWPFLGSFVVDMILAFAPITNPIVFIALQFVAGCFMGMFTLLMWALIADCIDYQELITGRREEGTVYATYNFLSKFVSSFNSSIIAICLAMTGYVASQQSEQTWEVAQRVKMMGGLLPAVGCILAFLFMHFIYNLDNKKLSEMNVALGRNADGSLNTPDLSEVLNND